MSESQKTAVIFGLANKRSIAWAIAQKLAAKRAGAWPSPIKTSGSSSKRRI